MNIILANPRGFCAGVERAILIVERALLLFGAPIYVRHEVVHNQVVVNHLRERGVVFVEDIADIPTGSIAIFSAHGVSKSVQREAKNRNLKVFDATCPLVTKVHMEVMHHSKMGRECVLIGHAGHPEVEGTMGHYANPTGGIYLIENVEQVQSLIVKNPATLTYATQTTLSIEDTILIIEALKLKFPSIAGPKRDDICYATQNRQDAVKKLAEKCDLILVVGSANSSNSNRLREIAEQMGSSGYLINTARDLNPAWCIGKKNIGVTAGASAPEFLVQEVVLRLKTLGATSVESLDGIAETILFALPKALRAAAQPEL